MCGRDEVGLVVLWKKWLAVSRVPRSNEGLWGAVERHQKCVSWRGAAVGMGTMRRALSFDN